MKNILIATDFSNNAYNALFHAAQLLKGEQSTFHLLNVYDEHTPLESKISSKPIMDQVRDESKEGLLKIYHRIQLDFPDPNHDFKMISKQGKLVEIMAELIDKEQIELVVMGNSGCSEVKAIFMGSNALNAISKIKQCPILTIPKEVDFIPPKEIAFVTDYRRNYNAGLLLPLFFVAKQYNSKICVMHINEDETLTITQRANKNVLMEYLSPFKHSIHWMPLFKSKATAIQTFLEELEIDMLAMVNYEHSFLEKMTREPVIKRVAFDLDIPFLVIPSSD